MFKQIKRNLVPASEKIIKMTTWTPDIDSYMRHIPEFDGRREQLEPFIEAIDHIVPAIRKLGDVAAPYYLQKIKIKLTGKARLILDLNIDADTWTKVKSILQKNFGEKRNLFSLTEELRSVKYQTSAMQFLNEIKFRLRNVISKSKSEEDDTNDVEYYRKLALKTFINGLPENLSTILYARNPSTLEDAETILSETDNLYSRKDRDRGNFPQQNKFQETRNAPNPQRQFNYNNRDFRPNPNRNNNNNFRHFPQNAFQQQRNNNNNFRQFPQNNFQSFGNNRNNFGQNPQNNRSNNNAFRNPNDYNSGQIRNNGQFGGSRQFRQTPNRPEPMDTSTNTTNNMNTNQDFLVRASEVEDTSEYLIS